MFNLNCYCFKFSLQHFNNQFSYSSVVVLQALACLRPSPQCMLQPFISMLTIPVFSHSLLLWNNIFMKFICSYSVNFSLLILLVCVLCFIFRKYHKENCLSILQQPLTNPSPTHTEVSTEKILCRSYVDIHSCCQFIGPIAPPFSEVTILLQSSPSSGSSKHNVLSLSVSLILVIKAKYSYLW